MRPTRLFALAGVLVAGCALPATATATGGGTIATAPAISYGVQEFGSTATDATIGPCGPEPDPNGDYSRGDSWWLLPVTAGDRVTIDYEGALGGFYLFPASTSDYTYDSTAPIELSHIEPNGKQQIVFTLNTSGDFPIDFAENDGCRWGSLDGVGSHPYPGPYDFVASVARKIVARISSPRQFRLQNRSTFGALVHTASGTPITSGVTVTFERRSGGHWIKFGSSSATPYGAHLTWLPALRGTQQSVRVVVSGGGYITATSQTERVTAV